MATRSTDTTMSKSTSSVKSDTAARNLHAMPVQQVTTPDLPSRASILSLPLELFYMVTEYFDESSYLGSLANMARTCKRLLHIVQPILFRDLRVPSLRQPGPDAKTWSIRAVYGLLCGLEENPQLRNCVESLVFLGSGDVDTPELSSWDVSNNARNESLFDGLLDRYVERGWKLEGESRAIREYPLQLALALCLVQKTLRRAHIKVPPQFWIPNQAEQWGKPANRTRFMFDNYNVYNIPTGIMLKKMPTFERLHDLTLESTDGYLNMKAVDMILPAMPNLTRLTFQDCITADNSGTIRIPEHVSSLTLDRCPKLRRRYRYVSKPLVLHDRLQSFFLYEKLTDLRGFYANNTGHTNQSGFVQVPPDYYISSAVQDGAPQFPLPFHNIYSQGRTGKDGLTRVLKFLSPAASSLEQICLGDCSSPPVTAPVSFRDFPKLKTVSIHCSNIHSRIGAKFLVNTFKDCRCLEVIELVGVDKVDYLSRVLLALAEAVRAKENGRFSQLKKVILTCYEPGRVIALAGDPFASMFSEGNVELILMAREGWDGNETAASGRRARGRRGRV